MNGQIKQRCGEVWFFTSMGNFSHHGQALRRLEKKWKAQVYQLQDSIIPAGFIIIVLHPYDGQKPSI